MKPVSSPFSAHRRSRGLAGTVLVALLALGALTACDNGVDSPERGGSEDSSSSSTSTEAGPPKPVASIAALTGNTTSVRLDQGFLDALSSLKLTPGVVGDAKLTAGSLIFPITGGNVTYFEPGSVSPYVIGQIQHEGSGLSLTGGGKTVLLTNFNVDPGVSRVYGDVTVDGRVVVTDAYLFTLDGRTLQPLTSGNDTAILQGTKVEISPVAATLLNQTFGTSAVKGGLLVGTASIVLATGDTND